MSDLTASMWPVDCQTCGRFLGDEPPVLVVDDLILFAVATLHHQRCRDPEWNDSDKIQSFRENQVSFLTRMIVTPISAADLDDVVPLMLVNPGLECVTMERDQSGAWQVRPSASFSAAGLSPSGPVIMISGAVHGAVARVTDHSIAVTFQVPPFTGVRGSR